MCEVLEKLRAWGCDLDGALERFLGDEELYKKLPSDGGRGRGF